MKQVILFVLANAICLVIGCGHYGGRTANQWLAVLGGGTRYGDFGAPSEATAATALKAIGSKEVVPLATRALDGPPGALQTGSARAFGLFGKEAKDSIPILAAHLNMRVDVAEHVSRSLAEIGKALGEPPPEVVALIESDNRQVSVLAAASILRIDSKHARSQEVLRKFLQDACQQITGLGRLSEAFLYAITLRAVGEMKAEGQTLLPELVAIISAPRSVECMVNHCDLRSWALDALTQMGSAAKPALSAILDSSTDLEFYGANIVSFVRTVAPDYVPQVLTALGRKSGSNRQALISCLWFMGSAGRAAVRSLLDDPDMATRESAFKTMLGVLPDKARAPLQTTWHPESGDGLSLVNRDDGQFVVAQSHGLTVVRAVGQYLYFAVDDRVAHDISANSRDSFALKLTVRNRAASFDVEYDGHPLNADDSEAGLRITRLVKSTEMEPALEFFLALPQARLVNRLPGGADFRIRLLDQSVVELEHIVLVRFFDD